MRAIDDIFQDSGFKTTHLEEFWGFCCQDYIFFAKHVLGFQVAEYHEEWYNLLEDFPRLSVIAFRGSGKTNFVAGYFLWKAVFKENLNFLILSFNLEQSKIVLKLIRAMIVDNEILRVFMPDTREGSWKATELTLKNGCIFYSKTYGEGVRGLRIDYLLCDEAGQYEDKSIFWTAVSPVVQLNKGNIIVIGTMKSSIDLLSELKDNDEYICKEYPAERDGEVLWPQKYTLLPHDTATQRSLVMVRKEIGELNYLQEYLLIPVSSANSLFPFELTMRGVMDDKSFMPYGKIDEHYYIGYDVAVSLKGDYTVMTILKCNADKKELVKALRFRGNFEEQKMYLRQLVNDFRPVKVLIDATGIGEHQAIDLQKEFTIIEPIKFSYDEKYKLMMDLRSEFEKGMIILPNSKEDPETYSFTQELLKELNDFSLKIDLRQGQSTRPKFHSGAYDDCVISLSLANRACQSTFGEVSIGGLE